MFISTLCRPTPSFYKGFSVDEKQERNVPAEVIVFQDYVFKREIVHGHSMMA